MTAQLPNSNPNPANTPESYSESTGLTNIDDSVFLTEDDPSPETGDEPGSHDEEDPSNDPTVIVDDPENNSDEKPNEDPAEDPKPEDKPNSENKPTEKPNEPDQQPKVFANKFYSKEDLENAYINLGGDPAKHDTVEKLEEAYLTRQSEFSRYHQQQIQDRNQTPPSNNPAKPQVSEEQIEEMMSKVDWSKIEDGKDLARQMFSIMAQNMPQQPTQASPEQMAQQLAPIIKNHEAKMQELSELESKVPRLKTLRDDKGSVIPNPFREAFAAFVKGQRSQGTYTNLNDSFKAFIGPNQQIVDDQVAQRQKEQEEKNTAANLTPPDGGEGANSHPSSPEDQILSDLLGQKAAYDKKIGNF